MKLKASSKEKSKTPDKKPVESGDKKASQNEINRVQQQSIPPHSIPSQPVAPTASQDANQENSKKVLEFFNQQSIMEGVETYLCQQLKLPDQKIKDYVKDIKESVQDNLSKLKEILNALPSDEQQLLFDYCVKETKHRTAMYEYNKQLHETFKQVNEHYNQLDNLLKEGEHYQIDVKGNASEPIFQDMIKAGREVPESIGMSSSDLISKCMKMEKAFLKCSSEDQATYLPHLKDIRSLFMSLSEKNKSSVFKWKSSFLKCPLIYQSYYSRLDN